MSVETVLLATTFKSIIRAFINWRVGETGLKCMYCIPRALVCTCCTDVAHYWGRISELSSIGFCELWLKKLRKHTSKFVAFGFNNFRKCKATIWKTEMKPVRNALTWLGSQQISKENKSIIFIWLHQSAFYSWNISQFSIKENHFKPLTARFVWLNTAHKIALTTEYSINFFRFTTFQKEPKWPIKTPAFANAKSNLVLHSAIPSE